NNDQEEQNEGADQGQPVSPEPAPGIRPEAGLLPRQRIADVLFRGRDAGRGCHLAPSVPDSRVDRRIQEIHEQVGEPDRQRIESEDPDHDVVVPGQNALHELLPQPGDPEDVLDHDAARNDADGERPQNGYDWDQGVSQRVPDDDDAVAQALSLRCTDIVLAQHLQHAGPGQPGHDAAIRYSESKGGNRDLAERPVGTVPADFVVDRTSAPVVQVDGEYEHHDRGDNEVGHALAAH